MNAFHKTDRYDEPDLGPLAGLPTIPAAGLDEFNSGANVEAINQPEPASQKTNPAQGSALLRLLQAIVNNPGLPSSKYPKLAGMSPRKAVEVRNQLVEQKLIRETELQTKARGRAAIVLTPTDKGTDLLSKLVGNTGGSRS